MAKPPSGGWTLLCRRAHRPHDRFAGRAAMAPPRSSSPPSTPTSPRDMEPRFAAAGYAVVSNSSAFRMTQDVPLVIPEVNGDHIALIEEQTGTRSTAATWSPTPTARPSGWCWRWLRCTERFGIDQIFVATMQAITGAGYPGVPSMDILGNVIPYIARKRTRWRPSRANCWARSKVANHSWPTRVSAHCNRVAVEDGHTETVSLKLEPAAASAKTSLPAWAEFQWLPQRPISPSRRNILSRWAAPDRPQPRLDRDRGRGMSWSWAACVPAISSTGNLPCSRTTPSAAPPALLF